MFTRRVAVGMVSTLVFAGLLGTPARAAEVTGKWSWTVRVQDQEIQRQAEFKQAGEKLSGTLTGASQPVSEIQEGMVKGDQISFVLLRERDGQQIRIRYEGKLAGDTIKGKITIPIGGENRTFDWDAKRVKAAAIAGNWTSAVKGPDGEEVMLRFEFRQEGDKLAGLVIRGEDKKYELREGKFAAGEVSFLVVADRDGQELQVRFKGKLEGDTIKGKITLTVGGQDRDLDWEAKRAAA